jgi:hypothetical protein
VALRRRRWNPVILVAAIARFQFRVPFLRVL